MAQAPTIETTGETVSEDTEPSQIRTKVETADIPVYSVARAVEWMNRPENAPKIEKFATEVKQATKEIAQGIDREVSKTWRLFVDIATDEDVEEDFVNHFLGTLIGDD